jgi:hypothetical protein
MSIRLHESWISALRHLPETGMGYQVLEFRGLAPGAEHVIVANASRTVDVARGRLVVRERAEKATEERIAKVLQGPAGDARFGVLSRAEAVKAKVVESRRAAAGGPASGAPIEQSHPDEQFLRFSAFPNDIRILADGSVVAGTYVTTHDDGMTHVKTGSDAVRRYALPNPDPAVHRYYLRPPERIAVQRGAVQPAYGQPGGGVEVIFVQGAPAKTQYNLDQIPPG